MGSPLPLCYFGFGDIPSTKLRHAEGPVTQSDFMVEVL